MKKLFTLFAMLACVAVASAQHRLVATLSHNDTVSVYYGKSAFANAYYASVDGDVITLSSGVFDATDIRKSITIRGAGMEQDAVNNLAPTIIGETDGALFIDKSPMIEGVHLRAGLLISNSDTLQSAKFKKCKISWSSSNNNGKMLDTEFTQCEIGRLRVNGDATIFNCYIGLLIDNSIEELSIVNCVIGTDYWNWVDNTVFANSVLLDDGYSDAGILPQSNMAYNCITVEDNDVFSNLLVNTNNARVDAAFKDNGFYELIDSVKTKYLGTDGTEVGIYGGPAPFNPTKTSYPRIEKFSVSQMNENGEVKVDVKVSTVEE